MGITLYHPHTLDEFVNVAEIFAKSGLFKDSADMAKAIVKMMAGAEMGFGPFASMQGIHIIQGKPVLSAGLITAAIENDPRYGYQVEYLENDGCRLVFYQHGHPVGHYAFMEDDAQRAGLLGKDSWKKWPKDMYFSRAVSGGARKYAAGIFGGSVYTPDEFDLEMDEEGDVVENGTAPAMLYIESQRQAVFDEGTEPLSNDDNAGIPIADRKDLVARIAQTWFGGNEQNALDHLRELYETKVEGQRVIHSELNDVQVWDTVSEWVWPSTLPGQMLLQGLAKHPQHAINRLNKMCLAGRIGITDSVDSILAEVELYQAEKTHQDS